MKKKQRGRGCAFEFRLRRWERFFRLYATCRHVIRYLVLEKMMTYFEFGSRGYENLISTRVARVASSLDLNF